MIFNPLKSPFTSAPAQPSIETMAQKLGDRKGVLWAVESSKLVSTKTKPADQSATTAAEAWVKNPNPSTQAARPRPRRRPISKGRVLGPHRRRLGASERAAVPAGAAGAGANQSASAPGIFAQSSAGGHAGATEAQVRQSRSRWLDRLRFGALFAGVKLPTGKGPAAPTAPISPAAPQAGKPAMPKFPASTKPPAPPPPTAAELAKIDKINKPFIDLGNKILLDKSLFAKRG